MDEIIELERIISRIEYGDITQDEILGALRGLVETLDTRENSTKYPDGRSR